MDAFSTGSGQCHQPVEEQTAETVQAVYAQLFAEHGPPLVLKSDNGGPFRDERTKQLLAAQLVVPLYNPRRRPAYNGGVERANGQLAGYQEALAAFRGRATRSPPAVSPRRLARMRPAHAPWPMNWPVPKAGRDRRRPSSGSAGFRCRTVSVTPSSANSTSAAHRRAAT